MINCTSLYLDLKKNKCERWQQLLCLCFESLIVLVGLWQYNCTGTSNFDSIFSPKIWASKLRVRLTYKCCFFTDFFFSFRAITLKPRRKNRCTRHGNINPPQHCCAKFHQGHNQKTIKKQEREY